jgi:hypothetical protein
MTEYEKLKSVVDNNQEMTHNQERRESSTKAIEEVVGPNSCWDIYDKNYSTEAITSRMEQEKEKDELTKDEFQAFNKNGNYLEETFRRILTKVEFQAFKRRLQQPLQNNNVEQTENMMTHNQSSIEAKDEVVGAKRSGWWAMYDEYNSTEAVTSRIELYLEQEKEKDALLLKEKMTLQCPDDDEAVEEDALIWPECPSEFFFQEEVADAGLMKLTLERDKMWEEIIHLPTEEEIKAKEAERIENNLFWAEFFKKYPSYI